MKVRTDLLQAVMQWGKFDKLALWTATLPTEVKHCYKMLASGYVTKQ
jgi:hypothetical protein